MYTAKIKPKPDLVAQFLKQTVSLNQTEYIQKGHNHPNLYTINPITLIKRQREVFSLMCSKSVILSKNGNYNFIHAQHNTPKRNHIITSHFRYIQYKYRSNNIEVSSDFMCVLYLLIIQYLVATLCFTELVIEIM